MYECKVFPLYIFHTLSRMPFINFYLYEICHVNSLVPSFPVIRVIPMTRREYYTDHRNIAKHKQQ